MVTTVGTETTIESLLEDLVQLDYDAVDAYEAAINRLQEARFRDRLREFKGDHLRHIAELGDILVEMGRTPPKEGDMKSLFDPRQGRLRWPDGRQSHFAGDAHQ